MVKDGDVDFSLRELARKAGVTAAAPYHHFESKTAVLDEVAAQGFQGLDEAITRALEPTATPEDKLTGLVTTYLRFCNQHQSHYQLMFPPHLGVATQHVALRQVAEAAFSRLVSAVRSLRIHDSDEDLFFWAFSVWALCHGFLALQRDGLINGLPFGNFDQIVPRIAALSKQLVISAAPGKVAIASAKR